MSDYIKQLEDQNEELRKLLAERETQLAEKEEILIDLTKQLDSAIEDVNYYRERASEVRDRDWNSP